MADPAAAPALLAQIAETRDDNMRRELLRRACDLFDVTSASLSDREATLFDDIFATLSKKVDATLREEMSERLADTGATLSDTMKTLAFDDEISVARPVLKRSGSLSDDVLVEIAHQKGQAHMAAIADRETLTPKVTDTLVELGDRVVLKTVAGNSGATFSEPGMSTLTEKSRDDEDLQSVIADRKDLSPAAMERLVDLATERVRQQIAKKSPEALQAIDDARSKLESELGIDRIDFLAADRRVRALARKHPIDEPIIRNLAEAGKFGELVVALGLYMDIKVDQAKRLLMEANPLLIASRAYNLSPETLEILLRCGPAFESMDPADRLERLQEYKSITTETAQRVMRFWKTRTKLSAA